MGGMAIPSSEPAFVTAGDTVAWTKSLADYPASAGWTLKYRLINAAGSIDIVSSPSGDDHAISKSSSATAGWVAGDYIWQAYVEGGAAERYTIGTGSITVKPDLAAQSGGFEARGTWAKALADLRAALAAWVTSSGHVQEYEIAGRRMKFATTDDIRKRIAIAEREVAREASIDATAAGNSLGRTLNVRFNNG
jgi:hypothetical protein